jgi:hypothetical protein
MIGLAKACNGGGALANYVLDENKGYELDRNNLCGLTPKEIVEELKMIQDLNQKATNKTFSLVLSPDIKDSKNLSDDQLKAMTHEYLTKLGIDPVKQQYVAFVHTEKEHKHIHIISNRVQPNGKLISDHHIGKRGQWVAHEIAKERGLISAKEKMFENIKNIEQNKGNLKILKNEIFKKHQEVMRDKPRTFENYMKQMNSKGLEVKPTINKQGEIQGFRVVDIESKNDFKASEINRSMSVGNLIKDGLKNDLNSQLNNTLKATTKSQNMVLGQEMKKTIKPKSKNFGKQKDSKPLFKEKLSKKEILEFSKLQDIMIENFNIEHQNYWNAVTKIQESQREIENKTLNKHNER